MRTIYCRAIVSILLVTAFVLARVAAVAPAIDQTGYPHSAHMSSR